MTLTLDTVLEQRIQQELVRTGYDNPVELISHALDLLEAERSGKETPAHEMHDWLLRNREAINTALDESFAAKERGESYSPEEAHAILAERRAARSHRAA